MNRAFRLRRKRDDAPWPNLPDADLDIIEAIAAFEEAEAAWLALGRAMTDHCKGPTSMTRESA